MAVCARLSGSSWWRRRYWKCTVQSCIYGMGRIGKKPQFSTFFMEPQDGELDFKIVKRPGLHPLHYYMIGICKSKYVITNANALNTHGQRVHQLGPIPPPQKGRPHSHEAHWPKKDPKKVQKNNELNSLSLEFRMEMALKNLKRRLLEQEIYKENVNHEHEPSNEALERISHCFDAYKLNEMKRREDTSRRIEMKKTFNELKTSNEGSSSTMDNTSGASNDCVNEISIEHEKENSQENQEIIAKMFNGLKYSSSTLDGISNESYGFIEDCFQSDPLLNDIHDTTHMHTPHDSRVRVETHHPQERAIKHTKLTPKNLSQVGFRNKVAWLSHMQSNHIARRKPIRIAAICGNNECKK